MERLDCLSTMLYYKMNEIIGDRELVSIRKDLNDINDIVMNSPEDLMRIILSGSKREGFNMAGSDMDLMSWAPNTYVICNTTQSHYYNTTTDTLILAEHRLTRPGFVLLRLLHMAFSPNNQLLEQSYLSLNNHTYISSSRHRQLHNQMLRSFTNLDVHGPCSSGYLAGQETDIASCLRCLYWPPQAFSWLQRCQQLCWPKPSVLQKITHGGCHFVAIGAKQSIFENVEWRLSFSQAEQNLIYSFNHCQFLVYGSLKLFLKEVLNSGIPENQKLLCSYFMKTAVFWQIQNDISTHWSEDNFLLCFWNCFKLLIKWVNCQYCPNFFVPENNMFFPKITGRDQQQLLSKLLDLYNEGAVCLLQCPSIQEKLFSAIFRPRLKLNLSYELHSAEIEKDFTLHQCFTGCKLMQSYTYEDHIKNIHFFRMKFRSSTTKGQRLFFYGQIIYQIQRFILFQQTTHIHDRRNVQMYTLKKQSLNLMKHTLGLGCLTDVLYLAMYYYIDGNYTHALCLLQETKCKLYRPSVMYRAVNTDIYIQVMGGKSLSYKVKEAFAGDIYIPGFSNLSELKLELRVQEQFLECLRPFFGYIGFDLILSPFLFVHFLTFLCHHHLNSTQHRQQALHDLHTLVHNDDVRYIEIANKPIAWQLLGICHQLNRNPQQALECYRKSLSTGDFDPDGMAFPATHYRIKSLEWQLIQQYIIEPPLD